MDVLLLISKSEIYFGLLVACPADAKMKSRDVAGLKHHDNAYRIESQYVVSKQRLR